MNYFDFLQNRIAEKGFVEDIDSFNEILNSIDAHMGEYENQIAMIESTVKNINVPVLQLENDLNAMNAALN